VTQLKEDLEAQEQTAARLYRNAECQQKAHHDHTDELSGGVCYWCGKPWPCADYRAASETLEHVKRPRDLLVELRAQLATARNEALEEMAVWFGSPVQFKLMRTGNEVADVLRAFKEKRP
jgi:hypothetical protein